MGTVISKVGLTQAGGLLTTSIVRVYGVDLSESDTLTETL